MEPAQKYGCMGASILLKISCWLYNKIAGPNAAVTSPTLHKAIGIVLVTAVAHSIATYGLTWALGSAAAVNLPQLPLLVQVLGAILIPLLLSFLLSLFVQALMLKLMLPTTFSRGFAVSIVQMVIFFLFFSALSGVLYFVLMSMGFGPRRM